MKRLTTAVLLVVALVAAGLFVGSAPSTASTAWGHAASGNHQLRKGCHSYAFHYRVTAPRGEWMAELRLISPKGQSIATHTFTSGTDSRSGERHWRVCSSSTRRGVHTIRMLVTSYQGYAGNDAVTQRIRPTTFRFTKVH